LELETVRPDGNKGWVLTRGEPDRDAMGEVVALHGISMDITARKQAERALKESEARLRSYLDNAPFAIIVAAPDGRIVDCNPETYRVLCYGTGEMHGMSVMQLHPAEAQAAVREHLASLQQCGHFEGELRFIRKDGSEIWGALSTVLMENGFSIGFMHDVTEERASGEQVIKLEEQFRQAQKMEAIGRLAGGIAHDFNNLLMVIQSYAELLQNKTPAKDAHLGRYTQAIMKAVDHAASLTRQMLAFSRKQVLSPVVLDLNAVIDETAKMLRRLIGEDIELQVEAGASLWAVEADSDQIVQVLMNLCVNARDAMAQGGVLEIATGNVTVAEADLSRPFVTPGDYVWLSVSDTGTGISKEIQDQIFDPFFTTKDVGKGTGLGLATVYGIVKQSGGYIWLDSEPLRGSCFTIYLPGVTESVALATAAKEQMLVGGTETILIAEDEAALREGMREYLGSLGYTVLVAGSGSEAISAAGEHAGHISLLVTDLVMPVMGGKELSRILGALRPDLKTIYMSGYADEKLIDSGIPQVGVSFLQKPFGLTTLARRVRDSLEQNSRA
jgi:PAS domain S-box-containing protein